MPESQYRAREVSAKTQEVIDYDHNIPARQAFAYPDPRRVGGAGCAGSHYSCRLSDVVPGRTRSEHRAATDRAAGSVLCGRRLPLQLWL